MSCALLSDLPVSIAFTLQRHRSLNEQLKKPSVEMQEGKGQVKCTKVLRNV